MSQAAAAPGLRGLCVHCAARAVLALRFQDKVLSENLRFLKHALCCMYWEEGLKRHSKEGVQPCMVHIREYPAHRMLPVCMLQGLDAHGLPARRRRGLHHVYARAHAGAHPRRPGWARCRAGGPRADLGFVEHAGAHPRRPGWARRRAGGPRADLGFVEHAGAHPRRPGWARRRAGGPRADLGFVEHAGAYPRRPGWARRRAGGCRVYLGFVERTLPLQRSGPGQRPRDWAQSGLPATVLHVIALAIENMLARSPFALST